MDHITFISRLKDSSLSDEEYRKNGLNKKETAEFKAFHEAKERKEKLDYDGSMLNDEIVRMICEFDLSTVEIGMITFLEEAHETAQYLFFGKFEVDDLVIDLTTREILLLEEDSANILLYCAKNSSSFLEAILSMSKFLSKRGFDEQLYQDEKANLLMAAAAGNLAGGAKYADFFRMMLGY